MSSSHTLLRIQMKSFQLFKYKKNATCTVQIFSPINGFFEYPLPVNSVNKKRVVTELVSLQRVNNGAISASNNHFTLTGRGGVQKIPF